jgi:hypothetical protein
MLKDRDYDVVVVGAGMRVVRLRSHLPEWDFQPVFSQ